MAGSVKPNMKAYTLSVERHGALPIIQEVEIIRNAKQSVLVNYNGHEYRIRSRPDEIGGIWGREHFAYSLSYRGAERLRVKVIIATLKWTEDIVARHQADADKLRGILKSIPTGTPQAYALYVISGRDGGLPELEIREVDDIEKTGTMTILVLSGSGKTNLFANPDEINMNSITTGGGCAGYSHTLSGIHALRLKWAQEKIRRCTSEIGDFTNKVAVCQAEVGKWRDLVKKWQSSVG